MRKVKFWEIKKFLNDLKNMKKRVEYLDGSRIHRLALDYFSLELKPPNWELFYHVMVNKRGWKHTDLISLVEEYKKIYVTKQ
jgi:hypothetical protein